MPSSSFEEIDRRETRLGEISLRRRLEPTVGVDVYEVKLDEEYLMSSLFTAAERALADLGLAAVGGDEVALDVLVGGLGLGYTAQAALAHDRVASLQVVDAIGAVIGWHERRLLPLTAGIADDPRCRLVEGDFFELVAGAPQAPVLAPDRFHAVLLDIDHTPRHVLHPSHAPFYEAAGLKHLRRLLHPGGVFGLWSDDPPDDEFLTAARAAFATCDAHVIAFPNPFTGAESTNTVYVAR